MPLTRPLRAISRAIAFVFWREGIPGEFIASFGTMMLAITSAMTHGQRQPLASIAQLAQVVDIDVIHAFIFAAAFLNLLALLLSARWPVCTKWVRFVCYGCLFFVWVALMWALAQVGGLSPVLCAYGIPASIYAYGVLHILQLRGV